MVPFTQTEQCFAAPKQVVLASPLETRRKQIIFWQDLLTPGPSFLFRPLSLSQRCAWFAAIPLISLPILNGRLAHLPDDIISMWSCTDVLLLNAHVTSIPIDQRLKEHAHYHMENMGWT